MTEYRVGSEGATVFDDRGRLLAYLRPGAVVVPGVVDMTARRTPDQEYPTRRGYETAVIRPESDRDGGHL